MDGPIRSPLARRFVAAVRKLEQDEDVTAMHGLFSADAALTRLGDTTHARDQLDAFWSAYLADSPGANTTFVDVVEDDHGAALEFQSQVRDATYTGVCMLGFDTDRIVSLRTYYETPPPTS